MSMTAIVWAVLYVLAIALAILNPLTAALGYLLEYYMRPALKWWGDELPDLRYNLIISLVLGATFLMRRESLAKLVPTANLAVRWQLALLTVMVTVTFTVAINQPISLEWLTEWTKMAIIFPMLAAGVIRRRSHFNAFVVVSMLGAFWWGYEAWDNPQRRDGRLMNIGSGDSLHDNTASAHLITVLPFSIVYLLAESDVRLRAVGLIATPFIINTIILCNSRGSTVGLLAALTSSIFLIRSGLRLRVIGAGIGMALAVLLLADKQWIERQQSTTNYEEDNSASARLVTWLGAYELVKDYPLGTGGRGFHLLSPIYIPEIVEAHGGDLRAPHNTYAMVAAEWGIIGLVCYLGIYGSAFLNLSRVKRAAQTRENGFFYWRAFAMQLGIIAYMVAGSFSDRLYGEAGYWLVGLSYALLRVQRTEHAAIASATSEDAGPSAETAAPAPASHSAVAPSMATARVRQP